MRVVVQRVKQASVVVSGESVASIDKGLLILLGITAEDGLEDIDWLVKKITQLRIFDDAEGVMNVSAIDAEAAYIVVSQFTLHASTKKGNRPSYFKAAHPRISVPLYEEFLDVLWNEANLTRQTMKR